MPPHSQEAGSGTEFGLAAPSLRARSGAQGEGLVARIAKPGFERPLWDTAAVTLLSGPQCLHPHDENNPVFPYPGPAGSEFYKAIILILWHAPSRGFPVCIRRRRATEITERTGRLTSTRTRLWCSARWGRPILLPSSFPCLPSGDATAAMRGAGQGDRSQRSDHMGRF